MKSLILSGASLIAIVLGAVDAEAGCGGSRLRGSCGSGRAKLFEGRARGGTSCGSVRASSCSATPRVSSCKECQAPAEKAAPAKSDK